MQNREVFINKQNMIVKSRVKNEIISNKLSVCSMINVLVAYKIPFVGDSPFSLYLYLDSLHYLIGRNIGALNLIIRL